jgi:hypothetical protein
MTTSDVAPRRARTMAEMAELQGKMFKPEEMGVGVKSYRPRPTDVIITPFGKSGTTWLQQTFHTLRTRGDMDFDDISRVTPWLETAGPLGLDVNAEQRAEPRGFKSHMAYGPMPKGAKYVVSFRDPKDVLVSMHHFMSGWFLEAGAVAIGDFAQTWLKGRPDRGDYWSHLLSWWAERDNPNVLLFTYEQMSAEPAECIRTLAAFSGIALDDELLALTLERSSLAYMSAHKDRFDDAMMRKLSEERCGLPPGSDSAKVRAGKVGSHKAELDAATAAALDAKWAEIVAPATGFADYATFEQAVRKLHK